MACGDEVSDDPPVSADTEPSGSSGLESEGTGDDTTSGSEAGTTDPDSGDDTTGDTAGVDGPSVLPTPTGRCPTFADGDVTFSPEGIPSRSVRLFMSDAAQRLDGPLFFYWHGTSSSPSEALYGLSPALVDAITEMGGIVAAPYHDPAAGQFPWFLVLGQQTDDLLVADEVLACAIEQVGVDTSRIHALGMSAGGLQTAQMSLRRSSYLASVVTYSGGIILGAPPDEDPDNKLAAMMFHGGMDDIVVISFQDATENYLDIMQQNDRFGFICDHGLGHEIPDAQANVGQFFWDHPYGTVPSPYVDGLPAEFPDYCSL